MTQEEFKEILKKKGIQFTQEGETIIVSKDNGNVLFSSLQTLPEEMRFENKGWVSLPALTTIPKGMRFENKGYVFLNSKATRFNPTFRNKGTIYLISYHNKTKGIQQPQDQHGTKLIFNQ